jgi:hypothetical protein
VVDGEPVAGAAHAGLDLVGDEDDAVGAAPLGDRREEALGGDDETALTLDRLDDDAGEVLGADLLLHLVDGLLGGLGAGESVVQRVAHRGAVDLGGEGAEAGLVGHVLRGHRHGEVGAAVVGAVHDDDGVDFRCTARAIFTAFSTASAPELSSTVRFSKSPGVISASFSATAVYAS